MPGPLDLRGTKFPQFQLEISKVVNLKNYLCCQVLMKAKKDKAAAENSDSASKDRDETASEVSTKGTNFFFNEGIFSFT